MLFRSRFFFAQAHYRSPPDFSEKALINAKKGLTRIHRLKEKLEELSGDKDLDEDNLIVEGKEYLKIVDGLKKILKAQWMMILILHLLYLLFLSLSIRAINILKAIMQMVRCVNMLLMH